RALIAQAVADELAAGRTVISSTHDLEDARHADLTMVLANRVVAFGPPEEVLVDEVLREAYGGRVMQLADGGFMVDDPHHHDRPPHEPEEARTIGHDHP